jgi:hypothetical protein
MDKVSREWRKPHNKECYNQYSSPNIILVIKTRKITRAGHVARMGERKVAYRLLVKKSEGKRWEDNIKLDLQKVGWRAWTRLIWLMIGTGGGSCKCGDEPADSIKCDEFLG